MNNPYLIVPIVAWIVGQVIKFVYHALRGDFDKKYLYSSGGLPSTHAAIVGALSVTALIEGGYTSPGFGISVVLMIIVMVDAVNVRRAVGENRQAIKTLYRLVPLAKKRTEDDEVLDKSPALGHTPVEVIYGAFLGMTVAYALLYSKAADIGWGLQSRPVGDERLAYTVLLALMLAIGALLTLSTMRGAARRLRTGKRLRKSFRHALIYPSIIGLLCIGAQREGIDMFSRRWLVWAVLIVSLFSVLYYSGALYGNLRLSFAKDFKQKEERKQRRKQKKRRK